MKRILALLMCLMMLPLSAPAEEPWVLGVWMLAYGMEEGVRLDAEEFVDEGVGMVHFLADGTVLSYTVTEREVREDSAMQWTMNGKLVMLDDGITAMLQGNGMMRVRQGTQDLFLRRATEAEAARLTAGTQPPVTEPALLLGEWAYLYTEQDGRQTSILVKPDDYAYVIFLADGTYLSRTRIDGEEDESTLRWVVEDGRFLANDCLVVLVDQDTLQVEDPDGVMVLTRVPEAPFVKEQDVLLTDKSRERGAAEDTPASAGGWLLKQADILPQGAALFSLSPSGRKALLSLSETAYCIWDTATGAQTPITFDTARTRSVQDDHQSLEELAQHELVVDNSQIVWSADERYIAFVRKPSLRVMDDLNDLYVIDAATGLVFMPAAWGKDLSGQNFGVVGAVTFAPDGTLYALVHESGKASGADQANLSNSTLILYSCNPDTGAVTRLHQLPGGATGNAVLTCTAQGDLLALAMAEGRGASDFALYVGAQHADMKRMVTSRHYQWAGVDVSGSRLAATLQGASLRAPATVCLLDFSQGVPAVAAGLVITASGSVSELALPHNDMLGADMLEDRWRDISMAMQREEYMKPVASAFSPDGTKLLIAVEGGYYMMDLATRKLTPVSYANLSGVPRKIDWCGDYVQVHMPFGICLATITGE